MSTERPTESNDQPEEQSSARADQAAPDAQSPAPQPDAPQAPPSRPAEDSGEPSPSRPPEPQAPHLSGPPQLSEPPQQTQPTAPLDPPAHPTQPTLPLPPQQPGFGAQPPSYPPAPSHPQAPSYPQAPQYPAAPQYPQAPPPGSYQPQQPGSYPQGAAMGAPGATVPAQTVQPGTNTLAIVSLILAFICSPAAIITGHIALSKVKQTGEKGRGLALAGTIIGYVSVGGAILTGIVMMIIALTMGSLFATAVNEGVSQVEEYEQWEEYGTDEPIGPTTGELLDTPEKILAVWDSCDLAMELNNPGLTGAFMDDAEWYAAQEALALLMDPSAESDAIRAYAEYMQSGAEFDPDLVLDHIDATEAAEAKFCS